MKLRIIQLEDSVMKHSAISRVIKNVVPAEIDWVTDMYSGIKKIDEAYRSGIPYDLAITDMHYPLSPGGEADWEVGDIFVDIIGTKYLNPPIVICLLIIGRTRMRMIVYGTTTIMTGKDESAIL